MKNILCIVVIWLAANQFIYSQEIRGKIHDENQNPITGALIRISDSSIGNFSDEQGEFKLDIQNQPLPVQLEISFVGFTTKQIEWNEEKFLEIELKSDSNLEQVVVEGRVASTDIDPMSVGHTEVLGNKELLKAACCNLSESFETNGTVDVNFTDAVTGSKQISMLGLNGIYAQINWENMPLVRGLGEYYGMDFVPGTWIESIQVTKGAGSVINGYESMTGQINVEFKKPDNMEQFYLNGYQNIQGRSELNSHWSKAINSKWSTALFAHGNLQYGSPDQNEDDFLDRSNGNQINLFNRWKYVGSGNLRSQFGMKYLSDEKTGGQIGFKPKVEPSQQQEYGVHVTSRRVELFGKSGLIFPETPWKSIGLIANGVSHNHDGIYGVKRFDADQKSMYLNLIYQSIIRDTRHKIKTGGNFQFDQFKEYYNRERTNRDYKVPGLFAEYEYDNLKYLKLIFGLRSDYLSKENGVQVSPRIHMKIDPNENHSVRLSGGRGFRVPNLLADSPGMFINSRELVVQEQLDIESSWNIGGSYSHYFSINGKDGTFSSSFYRTNFENQVIRDFYTSKDAVYISNLSGTSFANSFQMNLDYEVFDRFDFRVAYKYDQVKQEIQGKMVDQQLTPNHRALLNLAYALPYNRWNFDFTTQYVGKQKLPSTIVSPNALFSNFRSDDYVKMNAQVTTNRNLWSIYFGAENLTNYTQENPIINSSNPFGEDFDASSIWGPIMGRTIYFGFRYTINQNKK